MKVRPRFGNELKEKLNDFRCQIITLDEIIKYLEIFNNHPYVFNLGHGLLPDTDPDTVKKLIEFYRNY